MVIAFAVHPRVPQDPRYHVMADHRTLLGIPNALNVLSNLPFAVAGVLGLAGTFRRGEGPRKAFEEAWLRWPYAVLFAGSFLTALGSSYYHVAPDNWRLMWDRLPMALAFTGLLAAVIGERASARVAKVLFGPLVLLAASSVVYWYATEAHGAGDLRPYALIQFGSLATIALVLLLCPARRSSAALGWGLAAYAAAKLFEMIDGPVLALTGVISGHTLKHLLAAAAVGCVAVEIRMRQASRRS
jgi:hypothetical protein